MWEEPSGRPERTSYKCGPRLTTYEAEGFQSNWEGRLTRAWSSPLEGILLTLLTGAQEKRMIFRKREGKQAVLTNGVEKSAPAEIRTRVPRFGGEGDIHYTTRARPGRRRAHMNVLP